jgi:TRAP transporter TAXI family solute receptor
MVKKIVLCCALVCGGIAVVCGCTNNAPKRLRIAAGGSYTPIAQKLMHLWKSELNIDVEMIDSEGSIKNSNNLIAGKADIALAHNDLPLDQLTSTKGITTVIPLFHQIVFITYRRNIKASSLQELVAGRKICIGTKGSATEHLAQQILNAFGAANGSYSITYPASADANVISDSIDVSFNVTAFNSARITKMLATGKCELFSLDNAEAMNKGSAVDGFCMTYHHAKPYIIPRNTYGNFPTKPCLTVSVYNLLLCRSDIDPELIYSMVKVMVERHHYLTTLDPALSVMSEKIESGILSFPLHEGTLNYLERDQPTFFERYAESIGVLFTLAAAVLGGFSGVLQWNKRRKKDRIDIYYAEVLAIRNTSYTTPEACSDALVQLNALQNRAFEQLIAEKLTADESFRIFNDILKQTIEWLKENQSRMTTQ